MKLYSQNNNYKLYHGNMLDMLEVIEPNAIDSIVTDPPYELNFMSKGWDNAGVSFQVDTWKKCFEVLKPGGYLLAFGGSRTFHRIACAIEDAGFEIRDTIMWLYGSGFPKSMAIDRSIEGKLTLGSGNTKDFKRLNGKLEKKTGIGFTKNQFDNGIRPANYNLDNQPRLGKLEPTTDLAKQWQGWGTALKPSFEVIIVARKPFKGSLADNIIKNGVGGINIDECRVGNEVMINKGMSSLGVMHDDNWQSNREVVSKVEGRFPANTILTYDESDYDEVCSGFPDTRGGKRHNIAIRQSDKNSGYGFDVNTRNEFNDSGSVSRYFYCAKASKRDRDEGLEYLEAKVDCDRDENCYSANVPYNRSANPRKNTHPTVKPTLLMQYLVRLVTPNNGIILDPFNGSGSTGKAVMYENHDRRKNYKYIGIELTEEYLPISQARIDYVCNLKEEKQTTIEDFIE